ncbi:MAG: tripartite tricarboxylate transporter TctB family protein [Methylibium sp.]|uniref:tripartite tricarboxylate transporter TctB family protein n=1 Tax=Methylibium sp. TaxID=2067992 RepID=UPI0018229983|nr:tripartite tricarboxylate transporter TctB family protein [Methylibium sp.]MBA3596166.1 tripartite tricarboxylate transporter TctB family protein [Methylibium sp.]
MPERLRLVLPHSVMLLVSVALYWAATQIDTSGTGGRIGPDFWPKLVIGFMGLLCLYEIVKRLVVHNSVDATGLTGELERNPAEAVDPTMASAPVPEPEYPRLLWAGTALIVGYVVVVPWLGFFVTTALFLAAFMWLGGYRRPLAALAISGIGAFVLVVVFMRVAYISLPLGEGPFLSLSTALLALIGVK